MRPISSPPCEIASGFRAAQKYLYREIIVMEVIITGGRTIYFNEFCAVCILIRMGNGIKEITFMKFTRCLTGTFGTV